MKSMERVLKTVLAVISIAAFALYIVFYVINAAFCTEDFFRTNISKTALLVMCILAALVGVALMAEDRRALRRRLKRGKKPARVKNVKQALRRVLPHICIVIPGMFTVFYCIDFVNPIMNFIYHYLTEGLLLALAIVGILSASMLLAGANLPRKRKVAHRNACRRNVA